jgi:hypothetical protein
MMTKVITGGDRETQTDMPEAGFEPTTSVAA